MDPQTDPLEGIEDAEIVDQADESPETVAAGPAPSESADAAPLGEGEPDADPHVAADQMRAEIAGEHLEPSPDPAMTFDPGSADALREGQLVEDVTLQPLQGGAPEGPAIDDDLSLVLDVPVQLSVEMGQTTMTIRETLAIGTGTIITLNRVVGEPVDLYANGRLIARGEVIAVDEEYGLRVTEVLAGPGASSQHQAA